MESFSQFRIFEDNISREQIVSIADAYVNVYAKRKTLDGVSLKTILTEPIYCLGKCYDVTKDFIRWAKSNYPGHKYSEIFGETEKSTTEEPDIHYAIKIDNKFVLDLTSRQFDVTSDIIKIYTVAEFKQKYHSRG